MPHSFPAMSRQMLRIKKNTIIRIVSPDMNIVELMSIVDTTKTTTDNEKEKVLKPFLNIDICLA